MDHPKHVPPAEVVSAVVVTSCGCWLWRGPRDPSAGEGNPYEVALRLHHDLTGTEATSHLKHTACFCSGTCRHASCVRPDHLEEVAPDRCRAGHDLVPENVSWEPKGVGWRRICRPCRRATDRRFRARQAQR